MSSTTTICPDCGHAIPTIALGGLCPFCLASTVAEEMESRLPVSKIVVGPASYEQLGPYRILDRLGEGGYGVVYRAQQERPLRRQVAIKIMKGGAVSDQAVARFEAERQALAMMEHPSIAHVYDVGETEEGLPYFVMELIEGSPISAYCDERKLSRNERLLLFCQVCEAVGHAHRRGIIHRDLKPSNILVAGDGPEALPKIIDFGIAKATETLLTERTLVTRDHQLVGTPAYMSPEQAEMRGGDVDIRADIYSLGVVLYELLTGTTPFRVEELAKLPYDEALRRVRTEEPPRPSSRCRDLTKSGTVAEVDRLEVRRQMCDDLDWVVMKALEKDPERRYETAGALARDLERFLNGEAIEARPPTALYLAAKIVKRHRVPVFAAVAVLLAMVVGTIVSVAMYLRAEEQARRAQRNEERAEEQARRAVASDERRQQRFSYSDFAQATPLLDGGRPSQAVAYLTRALRTAPGHEAAATRLLFTVASENWALPHFTVPTRGLSHLEFTPDGSRILVAAHGRPGSRQDDPHLRIYDASSAKELLELHLDAEQADFAISPDGDSVVVVSALGVVSAWDLESGEKLPRAFLVQGAALSDPRQIRFSPDGQFVACTDGAEGLLQVWRYETGEPALPLFKLPGEGSGEEYGTVAFSEDSRLLVFAFQEQLRVIPLQNPEAEFPAMEHQAAIAGVEFLPGSEEVASWSWDGTARIWKVDSGECRLILHHEKPIISGAVSPDGSRLITGTGTPLREPGFCRMWDLTTGKMLGEPVKHPGRVLSVLFSPDGSRAASGSEVRQLAEGAIRVYDGWTGQQLLAPIHHPRGAHRLAFSPEGDLLAASSRHHRAAVWSVQPSAMRPLVMKHGREVWRAIFDRTGGRESVLTLTFGGVARRWDAETGEPLSQGKTFGPVAMAAHAVSGDDTLRHGFHERRELLRFTPWTVAAYFGKGRGIVMAASSDDGRVLALGCEDGMVRRWSLERGELIGAPLAHAGGPVTAVAIDAAGRRMASGGWRGGVKLWDLESGELLAELSGDDLGGTRREEGELRRGLQQVSALAFSTAELLAIGRMDGLVRLWRPGRQNALGPILKQSRQVNHLVFSPDQTILAGSGGNNAAELWKVSDGRPWGKPMRHIDVSTFGLFMLWSPDGRRLVTAGSHDNSARVWDTASGKMTTTPLLHSFASVSVALRPGGEALLYGEDSARVWDLRSGEPLTPLLAHDGPVYSSAFDEKGSRFVTGTFGGSAYLWDLPVVTGRLPDSLLRFAEALGGFRLNDQDVLEEVPATELAATRREVAAEGAEREDEVGAWMRWLAAEPADRTTSPRSRVFLQEHEQGD